MSKKKPAKKIARKTVKAKATNKSEYTNRYRDAATGKFVSDTVEPPIRKVPKKRA